MRIDKYLIILTLLLSLYIAYFTAASFLRYENYYAGKFDLGNMAQAVWNTYRGRIFQTSGDDGDGISLKSRLSSHADFILILISPIYYIWADPRMLLLLQTIVLGLGAVFVYLLSAKVLNRKLLALIFAGGYLLNPSINYVNLYDFHPVALATTFLLAAFYFLQIKKLTLFLACSILAALAKEQVWLIISLFGLYIVILEQTKQIKKRFFFTKATILGFVLMVICAGIFYYLISYAIPKARGSNHFALEYYKDFGDSPAKIARTILFSPTKTFSNIFQMQNFVYLQKLFAPLGFISFLSPFYLLFSLPDILINLLSNNTQLREIYYQYTSTITPFVYISAIFAAKYLVKKINYKILISFLIVSIISSTYFFGPLPFALNPSTDMFVKQPYDKELVDKFIAKIPRRSVISATNNIGAHLSHRRQIFTVPVGMDRADYVIFLLNDIAALPSLAAQWEMVETLKKNTKFKLLIQKNDFIVFKKAPLL